MPFSIWGGTLRPGHCEVHPEQRGQYPCELCEMEDADRYVDRREEEEQMYRDEMNRQLQDERYAAWLQDDSFGYDVIEAAEGATE